MYVHEAYVHEALYVHEAKSHFKQLQKKGGKGFRVGVEFQLMVKVGSDLHITSLHF